MAYTTEDIEEAVVTYVTSQDNVSVRDAGSMFGIPKTTLHRKVIITFLTSFYIEKTLTFVTIFNFKDLELCFQC